MNQRTAGRILIGLGIYLIFRALNMNVSAEGYSIINLNLMSERQNTLILGGFVFLAGIVLFGLSKPKQPDVEALEKLRQRDETEKLKVALGDAYYRTTYGTGNFLAGIYRMWLRFFVGVNEGWDFIFARLFVGLVIGMTTSVFVDNLVLTILRSMNIDFLLKIDLVKLAVNLTIFISVLYSLRAGPILNVFKRIFLISLIVITVQSFNILVLIDGRFDTTSAYLIPALSLTGFITVQLMLWRRAKTRADPSQIGRSTHDGGPIAKDTLDLDMVWKRLMARLGADSSRKK